MSQLIRDEEGAMESAPKCAAGREKLSPDRTSRQETFLFIYFVLIHLRCHSASSPTLPTDSELVAGDDDGLS